MNHFEPKIIQGGMGVGVSSFRLAKAVSKLGQLGVVSGTALDTVLVRRLQDGDPEGHIKRAIASFPFPEIGERFYQEYFVEGGKPISSSYRRLPMLTEPLSQASNELIVLSNFVEVFLAKEGHQGLVGVNYLEKIQLPILPSLYGALLAEVDYVLVGAGIPREIPGILDRLARHEPVESKLQVEGSQPNDNFHTSFIPRNMGKSQLPELKRPKFLAIISSAVLAMTLAKKATGAVNGFVVEGATAGGHNAPPRGEMQLNEKGEPIYGPRDEVDLKAISALGLPFWLAGSFGNPEGLHRALSLGAAGVQVGTPFALCNESGLSTQIKKKLLTQIWNGNLDIFTDPQASPTGFPFKVARIPGTLSEPEVYATRTRQCDLGYLKKLYKKNDGKIGYRCPAEPVHQFVSKGGRIEETENRKCLCNALLSNIDLGQPYEGALVTLGDDVYSVKRWINPSTFVYFAQDVIQTILSPSLP